MPSSTVASSRGYDTAHALVASHVSARSPSRPTIAADNSFRDRRVSPAFVPLDRMPASLAQFGEEPLANSWVHEIESPIARDHVTCRHRARGVRAESLKPQHAQRGISLAPRQGMSKLTLLPLLLLPVLGCVAAPEDAADATTYTRTIVRFADDGSATVTTEPITATKQRFEHEAAVAAVTAGTKQRTLAVDSCGDWYATKFFDQTGYTGNELCLIGTGYNRLDAYCRVRYGRKALCLATWSGSVRSFWTGESALSLGPDYGTPGCPSGFVETFPAYEADTSLDECMQVATEFWIFTQ